MKNYRIVKVTIPEGQSYYIIEKAFHLLFFWCKIWLALKHPVKKYILKFFSTEEALKYFKYSIVNKTDYNKNKKEVVKLLKIHNGQYLSKDP